MSNEIYNLLHILDDAAFQGKDIRKGVDKLCETYGTEYIAQYIFPDTFPALYAALN